MEIYLIGYVILALGIINFFLSERRLYDLLVFSIPFTGTAVFHISNAAFSVEPIRISMFLGGLCLVRHVGTILSPGGFTIRRKVGLALALVMLFGLICVASLAMPYYINGTLDVLDSHTDIIGFAHPKPLIFKFQYVTQVLYFLFGCLLTVYFVMKNDSNEKLNHTIKIYLYSSLFVCCWGLLEFILFYLNLPYPSFIFNQASVNLDGTIILEGRPRISSVALEPSIMAQQLITTLPILFWLMKGKARYLTFITLQNLFYLVIIVLLLCFSATAIFGLVVFIILILVHYLTQRKVNEFLLVIVLGCVGLVLLSLPLLVWGLLEKLDSFSGFERLRSIEYGWKYFTEYPILGIGWGAFPTLDLIVDILTGLGILGLLVFLSILGIVYMNYNLQKRGGGLTTFGRPLMYSLAILVVVSQFSGFIFYSQYFWLILGLAIAATGMKQVDPQHVDQDKTGIKTV